MKDDKLQIIQETERVLHPDRVRRWRELGVEIVIGARHGYEIEDLNGQPLWDCHLNGGTFNLGHRHPLLVDALKTALDTYDIGNHHFSSPVRVALAKRLLSLSSPHFQRVIFSASGGEAIDVAIKCARYATGRRKIIAIERGYHGRTGLSGAAGDDSAARFFLSDAPREFLKAPFNDIEAIAAALEQSGDIAAVLMETIPATFGFPTPEPGYLKAVADLCAEHGALYIADEVQTGLMRSERMWAVDVFDVTPDILVTAKGLSGGLYPIAATLLSKATSRWMEIDGWAHVNTFGGAELGCAVALKALEIYSADETKANVATLSKIFQDGLADIAQRRPILRHVHQTGLIIGLETTLDLGGPQLMKALYDRGVWAIFANYDRPTLQFKPGVLLDPMSAEAILDRLDDALAALSPTQKTELREDV